MENLKNVPREYKEIPLESIVTPLSKNPRFGYKDIEAFTLEVKNHGIHSPIAVRDGNDHYELLDGFRRVEAAKRNNLITVPAIVYHCSKETGYAIAISLNDERKTQGNITIGSHYYFLITERMKEDKNNPDDIGVYKELRSSYLEDFCLKQGFNHNNAIKKLRAYENNIGLKDEMEQIRKLPDKHAPDVTKVPLVAKLAYETGISLGETAEAVSEVGVKQGALERGTKEIIRDCIDKEITVNTKADLKNALLKKQAEIIRATFNLRKEEVLKIQTHARSQEFTRDEALEDMIDIAYKEINK